MRFTNMTRSDDINCLYCEKNRFLIDTAALPGRFFLPLYKTSIWLYSKIKGKLLKKHYGFMLCLFGLSLFYSKQKIL